MNTLLFTAQYNDKCLFVCTACTFTLSHSYLSLFSHSHLSPLSHILFLSPSSRIYLFLKVLRGRDPTAVAVLLEDSAAVGGVFIAGTFLGLSYVTGNPMYDALGSMTIGGKLIEGYFIICTNRLKAGQHSFCLFVKKLRYRELNPCSVTVHELMHLLNYG